MARFSAAHCDLSRADSCAGISNGSSRSRSGAGRPKRCVVRSRRLDQVPAGGAAIKPQHRPLRTTSVAQSIIWSWYPDKLCYTVGRQITNASSEASSNACSASLFTTSQSTKRFIPITSTNWLWSLGAKLMFGAKSCALSRKLSTRVAGGCDFRPGRSVARVAATRHPPNEQLDLAHDADGAQLPHPCVQRPGRRTTLLRRAGARCTVTVHKMQTAHSLLSTAPQSVVDRPHERRRFLAIYMRHPTRPGCDTPAVAVRREVQPRHLAEALRVQRDTVLEPGVRVGALPLAMPT